MKRTSLESVHLIQHVIREANLLLLWLRYRTNEVFSWTQQERGVLFGSQSNPPRSNQRLMFGFQPPTTHSPLSTVASRLQAELPLEADTELKQHLADLVDHIHALKDQASSMVRNNCTHNK